MRIAQIAPPWITVPPAGYGGTEWVVQQLCDGLVARGHEVALYATGDSHTAAELCALFPAADARGASARRSYDARHVSFAFADIEQGDFDLVHDHSGFLGIAFSRYLATPMVHTVHCAFDDARLRLLRAVRTSEVAYIGISEYQQSMGAGGHELGRPRLQRHRRRAVAVHAREGRLPARLRPRLRGQGLPPHHRGGQAHRPQAHHGRRAAGAVPRVLRGAGRAAHRRRADRLRGRGERRAQARAVRARPRLRLPHHLAGAVRPRDDRGHGHRHAGRGAAPGLGARGRRRRRDRVRRATTFEEFVAAVGRVGEIDPAVCRRTVEERFTVERMVADYEAIYRRVLGREPGGRRAPDGRAGAAARAAYLATDAPRRGGEAHPRPSSSAATPSRRCASSPPPPSTASLTSPPYFGHRRYAGGGIGAEGRWQDYVAALGAVTAELRRVLKPTGSLWLNLGDTYRGKRQLGHPLARRLPPHRRAGLDAAQQRRLAQGQGRPRHEPRQAAQRARAAVPLRAAAQGLLLRRRRRAAARRARRASRTAPWSRPPA